MEFLTWLALILLTLTGYSAGAVLALWRKASKRVQITDPSLLDAAVVVLLWIGVILARSAGVGKWWTILLGLGLGLIAGFVLTLLQPRRGETKSSSLTL
jgi:hypothetical protein